jgi:hypothetical protein
MLQFLINIGNPERISPATPWTRPHSYTDVGRNKPVRALSAG